MRILNSRMQAAAPYRGVIHSREMEIPEDYLEEIKAILDSQIQCELHGNVDMLYEFILPSIRVKRETERADEPELTKSSIKQFTVKLESATLHEVSCLEYHETSKIYGSCPAAVMEYKIKYNNKLSIFKTIWVLFNGIWYSTSLNKSRF